MAHSVRADEGAAAATSAVPCGPDLPSKFTDAFKAWTAHEMEKASKLLIEVIECKPALDDDALDEDRGGAAWEAIVEQQTVVKARAGVLMR